MKIVDLQQKNIRLARFLHNLPCMRWRARTNLAFSREGAGFVCIVPPMPQGRHPVQSQTSGCTSLSSALTCNSVKNSSSRPVKRLSM